jgi:hypothetical protein
MPRLRQILHTSVLLALGCSSPTESDSVNLSGRWVTAPEDLSPSGWYQTHLHLGHRGSMVYYVRSYGLDGRPREELSAFTRTEGTYRIEGNRLFINPRRLVWWDRFYGPSSPEHIEEPYPYGVLLDEARYTLDAEELTIEYLSYPFDAPVATSVQFTRAQ